MIETKEKPAVAETDSTPRRKDSANVMLTVKLMIIATVLLGALWILDALVSK
jgi:cytoskeletal protein RodZ